MALVYVEEKANNYSQLLRKTIRSVISTGMDTVVILFLLPFERTCVVGSLWVEHSHHNRTCLHNLSTYVVRCLPDYQDVQGCRALQLLTYIHVVCHTHFWLEYLNDLVVAAVLHVLKLSRALDVCSW